MLSAQGMSTRAIAPAVGVDQSNVVRDLQVMRSASPEPAPAESIDPATGEVLDTDQRPAGWSYTPPGDPPAER